MIDWSEDNNRLFVKEWGNSGIHWQQSNRDVLNKAIKIYNEFVLGSIDDLDLVIKEIKYASGKLKDECGTYEEDIDLMKYRLDEFIDEMGK